MPDLKGLADGQDFVSTLTVLHGKGKGKTFLLRPGNPVHIGRGISNEISIPDTRLSRVHCRFEYVGPRCVLSDLNSSNGTLVNGRRVNKAALQNGDTITVGDLNLCYTSSEGGKPAPAATVLEKKEGGWSFKFCDRCDGSIPESEFENGRACEIDGKFYCYECGGADPFLGEEVGGCRVIEKLGQGGMGSVYRAQHVETDKEVALKLIVADADETDKTAVQRFVREARSGKKLAHPNIVQLYDAGENENVYYIVMEFVKGQSIDEILQKEGKFGLIQAFDVAIQIARALSHAYEQKVIHRDIKPDNIIITSDGIVKLADLGLAKSLADPAAAGVTQSGMFLGTLDYMPPEQATDAKNVDHRADIYSLGATLFHMVTGKSPYQGFTPVQVIRKMMTEEIRSPKELRPSLPEPVCKVILKMMRRRPEERYQTPDELLKHLEALRRAITQTAKRIADAKLRDAQE